MTKGDIISGTVGGTSKEPKLSKRGQPFTGVKVDGSWYQVWGDKTGLRYGEQVELEVSWAPEDGPVFCTMGEKGNGQQTSQRPQRSLEERVAELEELVRKHEVQLQAMASADVPEDIPF